MTQKWSVTKYFLVAGALPLQAESALYSSGGLHRLAQPDTYAWTVTVDGDGAVAAMTAGIKVLADIMGGWGVEYDVYESQMHLLGGG